MAETDIDFWDYSLILYRSAGVADHCLSLQDDYGFDVNLVLFCAWYGHRFGNLPPTLLDQAVAFSTAWRESVVQPLRNVRKIMKGNEQLAATVPISDYTALRENIKKTELQAEKLQQEELQRLVNRSQESAEAEREVSATLTNFSTLCRTLQKADDDGMSEHLRAIAVASEKLS